jgi:hypothetical protein
MPDENADSRGNPIVADVTAAQEILSQLNAAIVEAQAKLVEINNAATQAVTAITQITDQQAVIASKSEHIQNAQDHADKVRADLDRVLTSTTQQMTEAEGLKARSQSAADISAALLAEVRAAKSTLDTEVAAAVAARKLAEQSTDATKGLADKAVALEQGVRDYEIRLADLEKRCAGHLKEILGLLPGATTAGLAHAFNDRRQTFLKPQNRWQWLFIGSVGMIVIIAVTGLWQVYKSGTGLTFTQLMLLWLARLPVAGALVWLAMHASHEAALAKRLEEDYGYKAVIASSFLGFHKQMSELGEAVTTNQPLSKLCSDTLTTIASPPGRIYGGHKLTVSPVDELKSATVVATQAVVAAKTPPKA